MGDKNWLCCIRNRSTASQVWGDINPSRLGQFLVVSESTMKMRQMLGIFVNSVIFLDGRQETHLENKKKHQKPIQKFRNHLETHPKIPKNIWKPIQKFRKTSGNPSKNSETIWKPIQKFRKHLETHPKLKKKDLPDYRDLELFRHLTTMATDALQSGATWAEASAQQVLDSPGTTGGMTNGWGRDGKTCGFFVDRGSIRIFV